MKLCKEHFFVFFMVILLMPLNINSSDFIIVQSTTSTRDSGFYDFVIPRFKKQFGIDVKIIAVGTGQAIKNAERCDADVLIVHHKDSEESFVEEGHGLYRKEFMYNDFILVGPQKRQNQFNSIKSISEALSLINNNEWNFISRGDNSGTHKKEIDLWKYLSLQPDSKKLSWYFEVGQGMGSTLNIAVNKDAFTLTDRATWLSFNNKKDHRIIVENDPRLFNFYGIIPINPKKCPETKFRLAQNFIGWITSQSGKNAIESFKVDGNQLFFATKKKL